MVNKLLLKIMQYARKYFRNSWVHKLPVTDYIYSNLFRYVYKGNDTQVIFREHQFMVPTNDITIAPSLIAGEYEAFELKLFKSVAEKCNCVFDVGANIGIFAIEAASAVGNVGKVVCFEPVSANIKYLKKNIELNKFADRVIVEHLAVGNKNGKAKIYLETSGIGTHSMGRTSDVFEDVMAVTIDRYVERKGFKPELIKIDIEGYDGYAIDGAKKYLQKEKPTIFVEYVKKHLKDAGYDPENLLSFMFSNYSNAYMINENPNGLESIRSKSKLDSINSTNLIFSENFLHVKALKKFINNE